MPGYTDVCVWIQSDKHEALKKDLEQAESFVFMEYMPSPTLSLSRKVSTVPSQGSPRAYTLSRSKRCSVSSWLKL